MKNNKIFILFGICVIIIITIIIIVIAKFKNRNKVTYNDGQTYKVKIELPETNKDNQGYVFVKNDNEEAKEQLNNVFSDFAIVGEKVNIEFEKKAYVFQNTSEYQEKYGKKEANFQNFKEYILDEELNGKMYSNIEEITINNIEAIQYTYKNTIIIVENTDKIDKESYISIRIYPKNEEDNINEIIKDIEIQNIINTIKFEKK